jgi:DNA (cytosine-5)-methyltransferase 1
VKHHHPTLFRLPADAQRVQLAPLVFDYFAGGGGVSEGITLALGRAPDVAINHDAHSIRMHSINHPFTRHLHVDVWDVDPVEDLPAGPVGLAWFSPDCTHFSRAKGGKPVKKSIRGLAWVVCRVAAKRRPSVIILENVQEFRTWGPIRRGRPRKSRART